MLIDDENDLRAGLRALTADPPAQPVDRVDAAVRRAGAIRRRRAAVTAVAMLLPAAGFGTRHLLPDPGRAFTPVAEWPDARDRSLDRYAAEALREWDERYDTDLAPGETVRWLYSGRVPGTESIVVAFATCVVDRCGRLVLLHGLTKDVGTPDGDRSFSHWTGETRAIDPDAEPAPLSAYYWGADAGRGSTNVVFVLAGPDAARVTYESPARRPGTGGSGEIPRAGAVFAADVGYLSAPATITVRDRDGDVRYRGPVGTPDDIPSVPRVDHVDPGPRYDVDLSMSGQLSDGDDSLRHGSLGAGRYVVFVRCLGDRALRVTVEGVPHRTPCDGRARRVTAPFPKPRDRWLEIELRTSDRYTAFALAVARVV